MYRVIHDDIQISIDQISWLMTSDNMYGYFSELSLYVEALVAGALLVQN